MRTFPLLKGLLAGTLVLSAAAALGAPSKAVPLLHVYPDGEGAIVLGAVRKGAWVSWVHTNKLIRAGQSFTFYNRKAAVGERAVAKPQLSEASGSAYYVRLRQPLKTRARLLGVSGATWKLFPRTPVELNRTDPALSTPIADLLRTKGIPNADVRVELACEVDLDLDGAKENVIMASTPGYRKAAEAAGGEELKKGAFSGIFLRARVGGKTVTKMVMGEVHPKGLADGSAPQVFQLAQLADLNGDGKMEIVTEFHYYEGGGVAVTEWRRNDLQEVLHASDGL